MGITKLKQITLELIKEAAASTYTDEVEREAFMEGFTKEAAISLGPVFSNPDFVQGLANGAGKSLATLGIGLMGAALVKGISSTSKAVSGAGLRSKFEQALNQVKANNRVVRGAKSERVNDYAETIFKFAPHVASDPNLLSSILANAVLGEGIDPQTIKAITELESRFVENNKSTNLVGIKT